MFAAMRLIISGISKLTKIERATHITRPLPPLPKADWSLFRKVSEVGELLDRPEVNPQCLGACGDTQMLQRFCCGIRCRDP